MQPTRRCWMAVGAGLLFLVAAVAFDRPALVVGAAGIGAYLIAGADRFLRTARRVDDTLTVTVQPTRQRTLVDERLSVVFEAAMGAPDARVTASLSLPPGIVVDGDATLDNDTAEESDKANNRSTTDTTGDSTTARLETGMENGEQPSAPGRLMLGDTPSRTTLVVQTPIAGRFTFPQPEFRIRDSLDLYQTTIRRGSPPTVTVEPRRPHNIRIGGQTGSVAAFGSHQQGTTGSGIDVAGIRQYITGEAADQIDWKATARLAEPHVREFEAQTDASTAFIFDTRPAMARGPAGERKLDYLRAVALGLLSVAQTRDDPVGLVTVDETAITLERLPTTAPTGYEAIQRRLHALQATGSDDASNERARTAMPLARRVPTDGGRSNTFDRTVRAYVGQRHSRPAETAPLRAAIGELNNRTSIARTVLFTDDTDRRGVREAVSAARRGDRYVTVFLAPTVLFTPGSLADMPTAYEQYQSFETFRRDLAGMERVTAVEVGPGDRLDMLETATQAGDAS